MSLIDSKKHFIVVNIPRDYPFSFNDFHEEMCACLHLMFKGVKYIGILHDLDRDDNGVLKTRHYHIYFEFPKKVTTQCIIRNFSEQFGVDMRNCISDERVYSSLACVRYLLHLDDPNKTKYDEAELFYSSPLMLDMFLYNLDSLDIKSLFETIRDCNNLLEVYLSLGLDLSNRYRHIIHDIWNNKQLLNEK